MAARASAKTESARAYTRWDQLAPHLNGQGSAAAPEADDVLAVRAVMYTPKVHSTPDKLDKEISLLCDRLGRTVDLMLQTGRGDGDSPSREPVPPAPNSLLWMKPTGSKPPDSNNSAITMTVPASA
ncbi:hypothetical protein [Nonomuraea sp. KM90]|uniref:hypothetical protein n=1 Tax=Nonomuraea sp. KM90 TaxID=3457428 RepID=UPI003FCDE750